MLNGPNTETHNPQLTPIVFDTNVLHYLMLEKEMSPVLRHLERTYIITLSDLIYFLRTGGNLKEKENIGVRIEKKIFSALANLGISSPFNYEVILKPPTPVLIRSDSLLTLNERLAKVDKLTEGDITRIMRSNNREITTISQLISFLKKGKRLSSKDRISILTEEKLMIALESLGVRSPFNYTIIVNSEEQ